MVNQDVAMERSSRGDLIIIPSWWRKGSEAAHIIDLGIWNRQTRLGEVFKAVLWGTERPTTLLDFSRIKV